MPSGLSYEEQQRRQAIVHDIQRRIELDSPRVSQRYPERARQFMPFAALRGYSGMVREAEQDLNRIDKHELTEEEALALSQTVASLEKGDDVVMSVYSQQEGGYKMLQGRVDEVISLLDTIKVNGAWVAFEDIGAIEKIEH